MKLIKDFWAHLKEWSDWGMKDWLKAGIVVVVVAPTRALADPAYAPSS